MNDFKHMNDGDPFTPSDMGCEGDEPVLGYVVGGTDAIGQMTVRLTADGERWLSERGFYFSPMPIIYAPEES
jgi:hypothetical protein